MHSWFNSGSIFKNTVKIPIAAKAIQVNEIQYIARLVQKKCMGLYRKVWDLNL